MTAEQLMSTVRDAGGELWAAGDKLRYRIPTTATELVPTMRELKAELLQLLRWDAELEELYAERRERAQQELQRMFDLGSDGGRDDR